MPRIARIVAVGYPHHITQRGNYQQKIFLDEADLRKYLSLIIPESKRYKLKILAYCLMPNHVHFIGIPEKEDSLGKVFKYVNMKYSQYHNKKIHSRGHLFQQRFFSCVMDEAYTIACARYIERNPVRAKLVKKPWEWKWSSAILHCQKERESKDILGANRLFNYIDYEQKKCQEFIEYSDDAEQSNKIKELTTRGRPLGGPQFVKKLEAKLNRVFSFRSRGRPKKRKREEV